MQNIRSYKRAVAFVISVLLVLSAFYLPVSAADGVTEQSTYVLNRDGNGEPLYLYQSPCMIGYDLNNQYGGNGVPIQAFVYTMYNEITGEHFPTYCGDINVTAVQGTSYRRMNLEDSSFSGSTAGMVRAILKEGLYIIPVAGESDADHAARVAEKTAELAAASGAEGLTTGEAIAATQAAIWRTVHGAELSFPKYCRYVFNPTNTKYGSLCSYSELRYKDTALINSTIETAYKYLLSLEPLPSDGKTVSPASFTDLNDPVYTENPDGSYNITVTVTVDVDMVTGDTLTLSARLGDYASSADLVNGEQTLTLSLNNVPASLITEKVMLDISGYQTSKGYFFFDSEGPRGASQSMVGYSNSRLPVYAEVVATEDRILNIRKTANVAVGNDTYENKPLSGISFDIYPVATEEEYTTGAVRLPDATEYKYPSLADYSVTTDENGGASFNFLHHGLPDGVYLIVERAHPAIVAPIEPFYLHVPLIDPETGEKLYEITIQPKNEVKGGVHIEKDISEKGNDSASFDAYEKHTWIIGTTVPEDIGTGKSYVITDTLDNRLDYLGNLIVVLENSIGADAVALEADTDYTLTVTDADSLSEGNPRDSFKIELTPSGMTKIADTVGENSFNSYMLRVYFDAQINANAEMGTNIPNRAELKYVNSVSFEFIERSDIPVVYTGGANLFKVDSEDSSVALAGAVFELYRPATQEEIGAGDTRLTEIAGVAGKVIKVSFYDNVALEGEKVTSVSSGEDGKASIYGLAYGKYFLVETKAPDGYNMLGQAFEITVDETSHTDERIITVENQSGVVLPGTGGIGTTVFTASGITLVCIAVSLLIFKRKEKTY
ncbi:MAG: isopeptide-forming domain-containing fimbrial protein [Ruminococcaceae bacterium]|nr:isopeptide-forming domain-containing fimbrial protein [Oscillospiraceae bacterium]